MLFVSVEHVPQQFGRCYTAQCAAYCQQDGFQPDGVQALYDIFVASYLYAQQEEQ